MGPSAGNPFLFRLSREEFLDPLLLFDNGDEEEEDESEAEDLESSSKSRDGSCLSTRQNS